MSTKWPIIDLEVQNFFGVGPDCTCKGMAVEVYAERPSVHQLHFNYYPHVTGPVYEPEYKDTSYSIPAMYDTMYRGDDFGGHNIPYPHPCPPMPHSDYQQDAFVDLTKYYDNMSKGITNGDLGGYTMKPHGTAGWSSDKAYKGDILMRYMPKSAYGNDDYSKDAGFAAVKGFGNDKSGSNTLLNGFGSDSSIDAFHGQDQDSYGVLSYGEDAYGEDTYGEDAYGVDSYGSDAYGAESYGADAYGEDAYGVDSYGSDAYGAESYGEDAYGVDTYGSDAYGADAYGAESYGSDAYGVESYGDSENIYDINADAFSFGQHDAAISTEVSGDVPAVAEAVVDTGVVTTDEADKSAYGTDSYGADSYGVEANYGFDSNVFDTDHGFGQQGVSGDEANYGFDNSHFDSNLGQEGFEGHGITGGDEQFGYDSNIYGDNFGSHDFGDFGGQQGISGDDNSYGFDSNAFAATSFDANAYADNIGSHGYDGFSSQQY